MRIIAGSLKGRSFQSPQRQRTHPMSEKVRGALFNVLGDITGLTIADVFAGSGALGFEALSRGAARVVAVESDHAAQKTIIQNSKTLNVTSSLQLFKGSVNTWLETISEAFDVIVVDPPYDDLQQDMLTRLILLLHSGGLLVVSWPGGVMLPELDALQLVRHKTFGDAELAFYRRIA